MAWLSGKNLRPTLWLDGALLALAVAFLVFSVKAFHRAPAHLASPPGARKIGRAPASLPSARATEEHSTFVYDLGCLDEKPATLKTSAGLLRIKSAACGHTVRSGENETTGEKLLLFERKGEISTHYFPLKPGMNTVVVDWQGTTAGRKVLRVERLPRGQ